MRIIKLSKGYETRVCECHYDAIKDYAWHYNARYAMHTKRVRNGFVHVMMHHLVGGKPPLGMETDHINRDSLDNRCSNLRFVTPQQNKLNRKNWSSERGVNQAPSGRWRARLRRNGIERHLGTFDTKEEAVGVVERHA